MGYYQGLLNSLHYKTKQRGILVILDHILVPNIKKKIDENSDNFVYNLYNKGRACWDNTLTIMPNGDIKCCLFFDGQIYNNVKKRSLRYIYQSEQRKIALAEFKKYPIDKCPFIEKSQLDLCDILRPLKVCPDGQILASLGGRRPIN